MLYLREVFPAAIILSAFLYLPIYICNRIRLGRRPVARHLAIFCLLGVVLSILFATFVVGSYSSHSSRRLLNLKPFIWIWKPYSMGTAAMHRQLLLNILMFLPLGFMLPVIFASLRKWWKLLLYAALFSIAIETVQYFIGRAADIDDLIMNTIGAWLGYGCFSLFSMGFARFKWWRQALNLAMA